MAIFLSVSPIQGGSAFSALEVVLSAIRQQVATATNVQIFMFMRKFLRFCGLDCPVYLYNFVVGLSTLCAPKARSLRDYFLLGGWFVIQSFQWIPLEATDTKLYMLYTQIDFINISRTWSGISNISAPCF